MSQVPSPAPYFAKLIIPLTLEHQQWALMPPSYLDYIPLHFAKKRGKKKKKRKHRESDKKGKLFGPLLPKYPASKELA